MGREQLDFSLARIYHEYDIVDGDAGLGDIGGYDDFCDVIGDWLKHAALILTWDL